MTGFGVITLLIAADPGQRDHRRLVDRTADRAAVPQRHLPRRRLHLGRTAGPGMDAAAPPRDWSPAACCRRHRPPTPPWGCSVLLLQQVMSSDGVDSDYARWGWRIPFVHRCPARLRAVIGYRRSATESHTRRTTAGERRPLGELLFGRYRRDLLQVLILMTGVWLANNMVSAVMPQLLRSQLELSGSRGVRGQHHQLDRPGHGVPGLRGAVAADRAAPVLPLVRRGDGGDRQLAVRGADDVRRRAGAGDRPGLCWSAGRCRAVSARSRPT